MSRTFEKHDNDGGVTIMCDMFENPIGLYFKFCYFLSSEAEISYRVQLQAADCGFEIKVNKAKCGGFFQTLCKQAVSMTTLLRLVQ